MVQAADGPEVARGFLVVRASGAAAARAAILGSRSTPDAVQLLMRCPVPRSVSAGCTVLTCGDCTLHAQPAPSGPGAVLLTVPVGGLTVGFGELRPLMFRPVEVDAELRAVFASAVANVLTAEGVLDRRGLAHHLLGLAELVLRSALRAELDRADTLAARRRQALEYIRANLSDPTLGADQVAGALFISRRRLYQLFDDGLGVSERIRAMRLNRAKALLSDPVKGAHGVGEIARSCGFVSAAHFSRAFRAAVGRTPREFRERALARARRTPSQ